MLRQSALVHEERTRPACKMNVTPHNNYTTRPQCRQQPHTHEQTTTTTTIRNGTKNELITRRDGRRYPARPRERQHGSERPRIDLQTTCDDTAHRSVRPARSYVTSHAITRTPSKNVLGECLQPGAGDSFIDEPTLYHFLVTSPRLRCRPILTWSCPPISSPMFPHTV